MRTCFALLALGASALLAPRESLAEEREDIRFWIDARDVRRPSCGGCMRPTWISIGSYELRLYAPAGLSFDRFEVEGGGRADITGISPDGRTVHATLRPGRMPGHHRIVAFFLRKDGVRVTSTKTFDGDRPRPGHDCEPSPCSDPPSGSPDEREPAPGRSGPPPPPCALEARGPLRFATLGGESAVGGGWPERLYFTVALPERTPGELASAPPEVTCTTGHVLSVKPAPPLPGTRHRFQVEVASEPADPPRRLVAGRHRCTVSYALTEGGKARRLAGTLGFEIDRTGQVRTRPARCPKPAPRQSPPREGPLPEPER